MEGGELDTDADQLLSAFDSSASLVPIEIRKKEPVSVSNQGGSYRRNGKPKSAEVKQPEIP